MTFLTRRGRALSLAAVLAAAAVVAGCGGGSSGGGSAATTSAHGPTSSTTTGAGKLRDGNRSRASQGPTTGDNASASDFSPKLFVGAAASNPYLPLKPGTQWVRQGFVNVGSRRLPHQVVTTVTAASKTVAGVRTVAVVDQDTNGGQIAEQSIDWVATDDQGNVWYLGSYTESYEGGQFVTATDAWLAGLQGAKPGILMLADPQTGTPPYSEDEVPGIEAPTAQVAKVGVRECVPYKCYKDSLAISEDGELKWFAPGVGQIETVPPGSGGKQEVEKLVNLRTLSRAGLKQMNQLALKLDQHARTQAPSVYGQSAPATSSRR